MKREQTSKTRPRLWGLLCVVVLLVGSTRSVEAGLGFSDGLEGLKMLFGEGGM